jgi:hypothetical protein
MVQIPAKFDSNFLTDTKNSLLPVNLPSSNTSFPDVLSGPVFMVGHSDSAYILDTACTRRKLDFHNCNWPIVSHFYCTDEDDPDFVLKVQLIQSNHNVSFNNTVVSEIVFNYSKSKATHATESKHMPNADYDMQCFLAFSACTDKHPIEDRTQLVPLVQTMDEDTNYIPTCPLGFNDDWGSPICDKWATLLKKNSFTDEGKMAWAKACGLESECQDLLQMINTTSHDSDDKVRNGQVLVTFKNRMFYDFLNQHRMPPFYINNAEGKHRGLAFCCLAVGQFIDFATGTISRKTQLNYRHFADHGII